jgi:hypothetical protein
MIRKTTPWLAGLALALLGAAAHGYPGGTPGYQTDAAPFCASCHSSLTESVLAGGPPGFATKSLAENNHYALIEKGEEGYAALSEADRATLIEQLRALDAASGATLVAPGSVTAGQTFEVTVELTGGAGPVVGVALVDAAHRWRARPAPSAGWGVEGAPRITGSDGAVQTDWLGRRPAAEGRNLSFVNVGGISSDASKGEFAHATVVWTLRAPTRAGRYPLAAAYWYGTEKGTPLGYTEDPVRGKQVRGGFGGHSGRVVFSAVSQIEVH